MCQCSSGTAVRVGIYRSDRQNIRNMTENCLVDGGKCIYRRKARLMSEQDFFKSALSDFAFEAASGGAIRHLADLGYTVKQIGEKLTYPTPPERVRGAVWKHLLETGVILTKEPGSGKEQGKAEYRMERDKYGRTSFRLASSGGDRARSICFKEKFYNETQDGALKLFLGKLCERNGENEVYISCDFGWWSRRDPEKLTAALGILNERQQEYISGLTSENIVCYHRLDMRMREIVVKLYEAGYYQGTCYCLKTAERIMIEKR